MFIDDESSSRLSKQKEKNVNLYTDSILATFFEMSNQSV